MLYYRLYFMHPLTGGIQRFADFEAPDDGQALALAREQIGDYSLELWNERRKVAAIAALAFPVSPPPVSSGAAARKPARPAC
jgi:hypothetical protein